MRHRNKKRILNRPADQRKALMRSLVTALFENGSIRTTEAKAKALVSAAEKLITKVKGKVNKDEQFNAIRDSKQVVFTETASRNLLDYVGKTKKQSGFTRLTRIKYRAGDNALLVQVDLITE
ncbi:50S ribosomal protein L17 [bacterium DOLZORAL124_38_8]|nr:MAG: 50S ribosomal protein L17 [bacterium DOLZORAL124_38_8]